VNRESTSAGKLGQLVKLNTALAANAAELAHLEGARARFERLVTEAQAIAQEQAALIASKQQASQRLQTAINEALRLATGLQRLLTEHYGLRSEKLAEFGFQPFRGRPFRGRQRKAKPVKPEAPTPAQPPGEPAEPENPGV
jgi:hypothetical protein